MNANIEQSPAHQGVPTPHNALVLYHHCPKPGTPQWSPPVGQPKVSAESYLYIKAMAYVSSTNKLVTFSDYAPSSYLMDIVDFSGGGGVVVGHYPIPAVAPIPGATINRYYLYGVVYEPSEDVIVAFWLHQAYANGSWSNYRRYVSYFDPVNGLLGTSEAIVETPEIGLANSSPDAMGLVRGQPGKVYFSLWDWYGTYGSVLVADAKTRTHRHFAANDAVGVNGGDIYACRKRSFVSQDWTPRFVHSRTGEITDPAGWGPWPYEWKGMAYCDSTQEIWAITDRYNGLYNSAGIMIRSVTTGKVEGIPIGHLYHEDDRYGPGYCAYNWKLDAMMLVQSTGEVSYYDDPDGFGYTPGTVLLMDVKSREQRYFYTGQGMPLFTRLYGRFAVDEATGNFYLVSGYNGTYGRYFEFQVR